MRPNLTPRPKFQFQSGHKYNKGVHACQQPSGVGRGALGFLADRWGQFRQTDPNISLHVVKMHSKPSLTSEVQVQV